MRVLLVAKMPTLECVLGRVLRFMEGFKACRFDDFRRTHALDDIVARYLAGLANQQISDERADADPTLIFSTGLPFRQPVLACGDKCGKQVCNPVVS